MNEGRKETDSLGVVEVPPDKLWGAQTQRSLEHFSIGKDVIPRLLLQLGYNSSLSAAKAKEPKMIASSPDEELVKAPACRCLEKSTIVKVVRGSSLVWHMRCSVFRA
jgi:fumarate hydratase class II